MARKKNKAIFGNCKICGEYKEMTEEHIPPKSAFNSGSFKIYSVDEAMKTLTDPEREPWNFDGLNYKLKQGGHRYYTLCKKCNSYTGTNYVDYYQTMIKSFAVFISKLDLSNAVGINTITEKFRPLPFIKQILTMFASFTDIAKNETIKNFLLDKDMFNIDLSTYRVYMSVFRDGLKRMCGWHVIQTTKNIYKVAEIVSYPFIFVLLGNADKISKDECVSFGTDISDFVKYPYSEEVKITMYLPVHDCYINLPCDYRSKDEIIKCRQDNAKYQGVKKE